MVVWQYRLVRSYRALVDGLLSWHCNVVATYAHWQAGMPRGHICMKQTLVCLDISRRHIDGGGLI